MLVGKQDALPFHLTMSRVIQIRTRASRYQHNILEDSNPSCSAPALQVQLSRLTLIQQLCRFRQANTTHYSHVKLDVEPVSSEGQVAGVCECEWSIKSSAGTHSAPVMCHSSCALTHMYHPANRVPSASIRVTPPLSTAACSMETFSGWPACVCKGWGVMGSGLSFKISTGCSLPLQLAVLAARQLRHTPELAGTASPPPEAASRVEERR